MRSIQIFMVVALVALVGVVAPKAQADTLDDLITRVQGMMEELAQVQMQLLELKNSGATAVVSNAPAVLGASTFSFTESTEVGATNDDIRRVQELLKTDKDIYPEGITSGFYGPATTEAIRRLQSRFGLDPVGVIGPATKALLERLLSQQFANGGYPADILDPTRPTGNVAGATTSQAPVVASNQTLTDILNDLLTNAGTAPGVTPNSSDASNSSSKSDSGIDEIRLDIDRGEAIARVMFTDGESERYVFFADDEDDAIQHLAEELDVSESVVANLLDYERDSSQRSGGDEIDSIQVMVDVADGEAEVEVEYENGDDESFDIDAGDQDDMIRDIAEELDIDADDVEDVVTFEYDVRVNEIEEIRVTIEDGEAEVRVEMEEGDDFEFILDEDDEDDIIDELSDILGIDEEDIEDLLDLENRDLGIDEINVTVKNGRATVEIEYEDGTDDNFTMDEDDESDMIEYIAERLDMDEDEVEDVIDFRYED